MPRNSTVLTINYIGHIFTNPLYSYIFVSSNSLTSPRLKLWSYININTKQFDNSQSQRPIVIEEESKGEEEDVGLTKEELEEAEEIREKEVCYSQAIFGIQQTTGY